MTSAPAVRALPDRDRGRLQPPEHRGHPQRQLLGREWLGEIIVGAERESADPVGLLAPRGEQDDAHVARFLAAAELGQHVVARHPRQHQVEHDHVGPLLARGAERLGAARCGGHPIPGLGQVIRHQRRDVGLVVDHQDPVASCGCSAELGAVAVPAPLHRALSLVVHDFLMAQAIEHGVEQSLVAGVPVQPVEHELAHRGVAHDRPRAGARSGDVTRWAGAARGSPGDRRRTGGGREAVEQAEARRFGDGEQEIGSGAGHMRVNEYFRDGILARNFRLFTPPGEIPAPVLRVFVDERPVDVAPAIERARCRRRAGSGGSCRGSTTGPRTSPTAAASALDAGAPLAAGSIVRVVRAPVAAPNADADA